MRPTKKRLLEEYKQAQAVGGEEKVTETKISQGEDSHALVQRWCTLTFVRGAFPLISAILGAWSTTG